VSKPLPVVWDLEPHTAKKHQILRRYFNAWLPIISRWNGRVLYVDGFAGPGEYSKGEDGSPAIVLKAARDHTYPIRSELICLFVEADAARYEHLKRVIAKLKATLPSNITVETAKGDFNETLTSGIAELQEQQKHLAPSLVFVDPFGFSHTPFSTIRKIMQNDKCEVLINFMYEEINRFLGHADHIDTFNKLFGTPAWQAAAQKETPDERRRAIHDVYLLQLKTIANHVRSFEMLNNGNRTDYFLFFATNNLRGLEKMKEAMWKVDESGSFQFSDYTDSLRLMSLFGTEPDYALLTKLITVEFSGKTISISNLEAWVIAETPFLPKHIRIGVLMPLEKAGELKAIKENRRGLSYPEGTMLYFS
jgi:three-Cys-motif partner protein